jgi:molybdopterin-dependent oxidoreductase alpha subunit
MNQTGGFDCSGCAWPEPDPRHTAEFCEQGVKHLAWEATGRQADPDFFAQHTVSELRAWDNHHLENQGRLTHPMRYEPRRDRYEPIAWEDAFARIAEVLRGLDSPDEAVFYTSGRTSNEAAFLYQLMARLYGTNNLPDCSNLCHESSGAALGEQIGTSKGTVRLGDFDEADAIFLIGQNPGSNHPRMLTELERAARHGCRIVTLNPLREAGLERFTHPQHATDMLLNRSTPITELYLQPKVGGDLAALKGLIKSLVAMEDAGRAVLNHDFLEKHTTGLEALLADARATDWAEIEREGGVSRQQLQQAAEIYAGANRVMACWAMGLTQHKHAVPTIQMIGNLLLLGGHIGSPGTGLCPVRGHSNVQGDRTVGITEQPGDAFLDALAKRFGFEPPREHGLDSVGAIEAMAEGRARVFVGMGGNFAAAAPDTARTTRALSQCELTVQISTKLNESHLAVGKEALILPCLARSERDEQATGPQRVTVEDSMSQVHASGGRNTPAAPHLKSEPAIVAGIAKHLFADTEAAQKVDWDAMIGDYGRIRDAIADVLPHAFEGYNEKIESPSGFYLGNPARRHAWHTADGRARLFAHAIPALSLPEPQLRLTSVRSHDQFNTTVYGYDDRYRGVYGTRHVIFMHPEDMEERGLESGDPIRLVSSSLKDGSTRSATGFEARPYDLPRGCAAGYYPETNCLVPADSYAHRSRTPLSKFIPVTVEKASEAREATAQSAGA